MVNIKNTYVQSLHGLDANKKIILPKVSIDVFGGFEAASIMSYLLYKDQKIKNKDKKNLIKSISINNRITDEMKNMIIDDGFFYIKTEELVWATKVSARSAEYFIKNLITLKVIEVVLKGIPKIRMIRINYEAIYRLYTEYQEEPFGLQPQDDDDPMIGIFLKEEYGIPNSNDFTNKINNQQIFENCKTNNNNTNKDVKTPLISNSQKFVQHGSNFRELEREFLSNDQPKNIDPVSVCKPENCRHIGHGKEVSDKECYSTKVEERKAQKLPNAKAQEDPPAYHVIKRIQITSPVSAELPAARSVKTKRTLPEASKANIPAKQENMPLKNTSNRAAPKENRTQPSLAHEIILFWISMGLRPPRDQSAEKKAISKLERAFRGTLFTDQPGYEHLKHKSFSLEEMKTAIKNFKLAATDPEYRPGSIASKKRMLKMDIRVWLLNEFVKKNGVATSSFVTNLQPPKKVLSPKAKPTIDDHHPEVTDVLKREFCRAISQNDHPIAPWDTADENNFRKTSNFLYDFYEQNKNRISDIYKSRESGTPKGLARMLVRCVMKSEDAEKFPVTTGWLCSSKTLNTRFMHYVKDEIKLFKSANNATHGIHPMSVRERNLAIFREQGVLIESPANGY